MQSFIRITIHRITIHQNHYSQNHYSYILYWDHWPLRQTNVSISWLHFIQCIREKNGTYWVILSRPCKFILHNLLTSTRSVSFSSVSLHTISCFICRKSWRILLHVLQTFLHAVQIFLGYLLMLGFMTFNTYLCFSIMVGFTLGYLCFGWIMPTYLMTTEHDTCCT